MLALTIKRIVMTDNVETKLDVQSKNYANMLCDFMFKRVFGSEANKDMLIWFLNMVLKDLNIKSVKFIPTEHHGMTEEDRIVIFDIACECEDGRKFIIEMQKGYQKYFRERALYYTTYPINKQGREARELYEKERIQGMTHEKFNWDYNLQPVIVVAILNFRFKHADDWPQDRYHSSYRLTEDLTHETMTDALRFVFVELGRMTKNISELETMFEKWIYLMKNMHKMKKIPPEFADPMFRRLFLLAEINNFTPEEREQYYKSLESMGYYYNIINTTAEEAEKRGLERGREEGREEGRVEGRKEGRVEGRNQTNLDNARNCKKLGVAIDIISQATGLSADVIESL